MRRSPLRSPPRMRGKAVAIFRQLHHGRITPAYAGKSFGACIADAVPPGSPPRMRGKDGRTSTGGLDVGITPACAGKSLVKGCAVILIQDHPRVCGEKLKSILILAYSPGSPPRVRGKVMLDRKCLSQLGITPAYAGKSSLRPSTHDRSRDHPRVCGEKAYSRVISGSLWGSPPRVRGKEVSRRLGLAVDGITPACAGKSR